jgi:nucleotide-binding universal stress UspA family protein
MASDIIVSYDGTSNDDDALALGQLLAGTGASLSLAYVRHAREYDPSHEELAQHDAEKLLERGASTLGDPNLARHVVINPSTGEGLAGLAESEGASTIVFGSDYRTAPGHAEPGTSAQHLLEGGPVAIAVAPAGLRSQADAAIRSIALSTPDGDTAAEQTAKRLAEKIGAALTSPEEGSADLIVVGSQPAAPEGRVQLAGATRAMLDTARCSVLVVPRGKPVRF